MYESRQPPEALVKKRRAKKSSAITYEDVFVYGDVKLQINNKRNYGVYTPALESIHLQLGAILSYHCKVFVMRFDLRMSSTNYSSKLLSDFFRTLRRRVRARYDLNRIAYGWGREIHTSKVPHFHCFLAIDGNKVRNGHGCFNLIQMISREMQLSYPHRPENSDYHITNNYDKAYQACFHRLSYIAKIKSKDLQPPNYRNYCTSQMKFSNRANKLARISLPKTVLEKHAI